MAYPSTHSRLVVRPGYKNGRDFTTTNNPTHSINTMASKEAVTSTLLAVFVPLSILIAVLGFYWSLCYFFPPPSPELAADIELAERRVSDDRCRGCPQPVTRSLLDTLLSSLVDGSTTNDASMTSPASFTHIC